MELDVKQANEGENEVCEKVGNKCGSVVGNEVVNEGGNEVQNEGVVNESGNEVLNEIVDKGGNEVVNEGENDSASKKDDEERLVDVPFIDYDSDVDDEAEEASSKIRKYVQLIREIQGSDGVDNDVNGSEDDVNTDEDPEEIIDGNKDEVVHEGQQGT